MRPRQPVGGTVVSDFPADLMSAADDIHAVLADQVSYFAGVDPVRIIPAIFSDAPADDFTGAGASVRRVSFEIRKSALPAPPSRGDQIVHRGVNWRVIESTDRRDVAAWVVGVERAP